MEAKNSLLEGEPYLLVVSCNGLEVGTPCPKLSTTQTLIPIYAFAYVPFAT